MQREYQHFNGFVILHGTDTMAYTASALSFMLENLGKTVVITGSQIPLFEARSDAKENLLNSLIIAGNYSIPEVTILFNNKLFRGNRTSKISASNLDAFDSPNMSPLVNIGIKINGKLLVGLLLLTYKSIMISYHQQLIGIMFIEQILLPKFMFIQI